MVADQRHVLRSLPLIGLPSRCPLRSPRLYFKVVLRASDRTTAAPNEVPLICSGPLDLSAQDKVASALRTATPKHVFEQIGG
jgi:hypothetical protein